MSRIAVRGYTTPLNPGKPRQRYPSEAPLKHERVFVFDTETTDDAYQNLKIGFFQVYQQGCLQVEGLFYDGSMLSEEEMQTLTRFANAKATPLYTREEFIDTVFYPEVYERRALCIGFNLAFDVSRLATGASASRAKNRGGFTFTLSENLFNPPIVVKRVASANQFRFTSTPHNRGKRPFRGYFLDVQRLAEVLLQARRISLAKAAEMLNVGFSKLESIEHGTVTERYIEYNIRDVEVTYAVYLKLGGRTRHLRD